MILTEAVNAGCCLSFKARVDCRLHEKHCLSCRQRQAGRSTCMFRAASGQAGDHPTSERHPAALDFRMPVRSRHF